MKKVAKVLCIVLALVLLVATLGALSACNNKKNGTLVLGVTYYSPMCYFDDNNELIGFDVELAKIVADKLNMNVKFQEINWDSKIIELNSGSIDCIWNGFSITPDRKEECDFTKAYLGNKQVAVIRTADQASYTSAASFAGKKAVVEDESYGEDCAKTLTAEANIIGLSTQMAAMTEVKMNSANFAVVDYTLAKDICGTGEFANLMISEAATFEREYYGVGFKKGSALTEKVNAALVELYADGTIARLAEKYGLKDLVVPIE